MTPEDTALTEVPEQQYLKPSLEIQRLANELEMQITPVLTGNVALDTVAKQLGMLACHADAVDKFLDTKFPSPYEDVKEQSDKA